jgi:hypothetical protein
MPGSERTGQLLGLQCKECYIMYIFWVSYLLKHVSETDKSFVYI